MVQIDSTLISLDVFEKHFVCDLSACKGACCIEGESGAPLEDSELEKLVVSYPQIAPYLTPEGIAAIEQKGLYEIDDDGDWVTPLLENQGACAYTIFNDGVALCGIEKAYLEGKISFRKPISCYLYPVRLGEIQDYVTVNYHHWPICKAACKNGDALKVRVYEFLKEPLIQRFGNDWYQELLSVADELDDCNRPK